MPMFNLWTQQELCSEPLTSLLPPPTSYKQICCFYFLIGTVDCLAASSYFTQTNMLFLFLNRKKTKLWFFLFKFNPSVVLFDPSVVLFDESRS